MRLGVHVVAFGFPDGPASIGPTLAAVGAAAEDAGLDNLSLMDHYFQLEHLGADPTEPMLEGYTTPRVPGRPHRPSSCSCSSPA